MARRIGVIGGTGFYAWGPGEDLEIETPYGAEHLTYHRRAGTDLFFLPRHGPRHERPPHRINARAQIRALEAARVDFLIGVFNVGAVDPTLRAGQWVVADDYLDWTTTRTRTFFDDRAIHVDASEPFCSHLREALLSTGGSNVRPRGVYAAVEGPRLETRAEREALRALGAHVVGMTGVPEFSLAREAGLCYGALCFVANATRERTPATAQRIRDRLAGQKQVARRWLERAFAKLPNRKRCGCASRARGAALGPEARPRGHR